jgi:cysteine sulfinate desulfinase/cysteine desulfurase-like protein
MAVNNETGAIQPIAEISERLISVTAGKKKPHFHVDAVHATGNGSRSTWVARGIDSAAISAP